MWKEGLIKWNVISESNTTFQMEKCFLFGENGKFFCSGLTLFHILSLTKELQSSVTPSHLLVVGRCGSRSPSYPRLTGCPTPTPRRRCLMRSRQVPAGHQLGAWVSRGRSNRRHRVTGRGRWRIHVRRWDHRGLPLPQGWWQEMAVRVLQITVRRLFPACLIHEVLLFAPRFSWGIL